MVLVILKMVKLENTGLVFADFVFIGWLFHYHADGVVTFMYLPVH